MADDTRRRATVRKDRIFTLDPESARLLHALGPQLAAGQRPPAGRSAPCTCFVEGATGPRHRALGEVDTQGVHFPKPLPFLPGQLLLLSLTLGGRADCVCVVGVITVGTAGATGSYVRFHRFATGQWELERFIEDANVLSTPVGTPGILPVPSPRAEVAHDPRNAPARHPDRPTR